MFIKKLFVLICSSLISFVVYAQDQTIVNETNKVVDSFFQCDNQFFKQLAISKDTFGQYADLDTVDNFAYIVVDSVEYNNKNKVIFKKTIEYKGLNIVGYQNIFIPTPLSGQFYYWGFILDNKYQDVKQSLTNINWLNFNEKIYFANPKIYDRKSKNQTWLDNPYSIDMVIPKPGTVEKSLYLEPITDDQSRIICSIQGDIDKKILYSVRPDMKPIDKEYEAKRKKRIEDYNRLKQKENQEKLNSQQEKDINQKLIITNSKNGDKL